MSRATEDGEAVGEAREDVIHWGKIIRCNRSERGPRCQKKCEAGGIWCADYFVHPYKPSAGLGDVFQCRSAVGAESCWYFFKSNKDTCTNYTGLASPVPTLCRYLGENPEDTCAP